MGNNLYYRTLEKFNKIAGSPNNSLLVGEFHEKTWYFLAIGTHLNIFMLDKNN